MESYTEQKRGAFTDIPGRLFLDSCTLQAINDYGGFVFEGEPIPQGDRVRHVNGGYENLSALRHIFLINQRALFQWAVRENSLSEVYDRADDTYLRWARDVHQHTLDWLSEDEGATKESEAAARRLYEPCFGYLSLKDRRLLQDAIFLRCDVFLTMELKLPRNSSHLEREVGIRVMNPVSLWELLRPWAALYI